MVATINPNTSTKRVMQVLLASLVAIASTMLLTIAPAAAVEGPGDILPGGNGPDEEGPIIVFPGVLVPLTPTASIDASCKATSAAITVGNKTNDFHPITVTVDGANHEGGVVGPNQQWTTAVPLVENETIQIEVLAGATSLLAEELHRDCLLPEPGYELFSDCGLGVAHARLTNTGTDTAHMAVQYHPNPYALQAIEPGAHLDWPLVVEPNGSVDFTIRSGHDAIAVETFDFTCETPEPPVEPTPDPETETPEPLVEPTPEPGIEPTPVVEPEVEGAVEPDVEPPSTTEPIETSTAAPSDAADEEVDDAAEAEAEDEAEDAEDGLAFTGGEPFQRAPGRSLTDTVVTVLWGSVVLLAVAAGLLAWRRRDDESATLSQA